MEMKLGRACEIDSWMELVESVKEQFPGLETEAAIEEHRKTVLEFMKKDSAICAKDGDRVVGTLLFSAKFGMICCLAVDVSYRRQHVGRQMVDFMLDFMEPGQTITVTTYREGAPEGAAARDFYRSLGFSEGRLTEEYGSPVQEFVWERQMKRRSE